MGVYIKKSMRTPSREDLYIVWKVRGCCVPWQQSSDKEIAILCMSSREEQRCSKVAFKLNLRTHLHGQSRADVNDLSQDSESARHQSGKKRNDRLLMQQFPKFEGRMDLYRVIDCCILYPNHEVKRPTEAHDFIARLS